MSILPHPVRAILHRLGQSLPQSCLLCGTSAPEILCADCQKDLPRMGGLLCPQCAEPTSVGERCGRCLHRPPHFDRTMAVFRYDFPLDALIQALKYGHQLALAPWLGKRLSDIVEGDYDAMLPLPLHPDRLRERGFNQAGEIARMVSRSRNLPLALDLLRRERPTDPQAGLAHDQRPANVRNAFACSTDLSGRRLLLVDDVMTTGATLDEAARTLKLHGAARVDVAVVARALRN